ncbi:hypothetical protein HDU96_001123 [Phlyctochytrium bullatum]|nr:hypothetical protein HDU96_001123 [Phlyctochytrium bullatum]
MAIDYDCPHCDRIFAGRRTDFINHLTNEHTYDKAVAVQEADKQKSEQILPKPAAVPSADMHARLAKLEEVLLAKEANPQSTTPTTSSTVAANPAKRKQRSSVSKAGQASTSAGPVTRTRSSTTATASRELEEGAIMVSDEEDDEFALLKKVKTEPNGGGNEGADTDGTGSATTGYPTPGSQPQRQPPLQSLPVGPGVDRDIFWQAAETMLKNESAEANRVPAQLNDSEKFAWRLVMAMDDPESALSQGVSKVIAVVDREFGDIPKAELSAWLLLDSKKQVDTVESIRRRFQTEVQARRGGRAPGDVSTMRDELLLDFLDLLTSKRVRTLKTLDPRVARIEAVLKIDSSSDEAKEKD